MNFIVYRKSNVTKVVSEVGRFATEAIARETTRHLKCIGSHLHEYWYEDNSKNTPYQEVQEQIKSLSEEHEYKKCPDKWNEALLTLIKEQKK